MASLNANPARMSRSDQREQTRLRILDAVLAMCGGEVMRRTVARVAGAVPRVARAVVRGGGGDGDVARDAAERVTAWIGAHGALLE